MYSHFSRLFFTPDCFSWPDMSNISWLGPMEEYFTLNIKLLHSQKLQTVSWAKLMLSVGRFYTLIYLSGEFLLSSMPFSTSPLLIRSALCFSLAVAWRERKTFVFIHHFPHSPDLNHNLCTPWPCIDFPSHLLSDWPAEGMCADTWPAITPLTSQTVNTDRLHTVSPSGLRFDQSCGS